MQLKWKHLLLIPLAYAIAQEAAAPPKPAAPPVLTGQAELDLLLHPKALGVQSASLTRTAFANPPAANRSMPLWVWNDELQWPRLAQQLSQFKAQGMGGVFIHPRPGLMTEYLGAEWFRLWKLSVAEGKRLGIEVNIYDENSYPSGFAGGHVPAVAPDTAAQYVTPDFVEAPPTYSSRASGVATFVVDRDSKGRSLPRAVSSSRRKPRATRSPYFD